MTGGPLDVLIVDDSAVVRQVLSLVIGRDRAVGTVDTAADPLVAMRKMNQHWPHVVVLDVEMPRMDGLTFLRQLMALRPTPVVICSTLTEKGAQTTLDAISAGAVAVVSKPRTGLKAFLEDGADQIVQTVIDAAAGDMLHMTRALAAMPPARHGTARPAPGTRPPAPGPHSPALRLTTDAIVALGTSTGGTQALEVVLRALPRLDAGIVIVQHMPAEFTAAFARRLDALCEGDIVEARDGERVLPGRVHIAPGGRHMSVVRSGAQYRIALDDSPPVNRHRPSVDVLFTSVAACAGRNALGVIMTGMGDDGARGLLQMRRAGARTLAQDEATCVVYGMPAEAVRMGAVDAEVPLDRIAALVESFAIQR